MSPSPRLRWPCQAQPGAAGVRAALRPGPLKYEGFSLIEILVTMAIAAIVSAMGVLCLPRLVASFRLAAGAQEVANVLHLARVDAIETTRQHRVWFEVDAHEYRLEQRGDDGVWGVLGGVKVLPRGISILSANSGGDLVFFPRGHCENGTVVLADAFGNTRRVILNQRGRVRLE